MMEVIRINPEDGFLRDFTEVRSRVQSLETRPLGNIVVRETITTEDPLTGVRTTLGQLPDGSYGFQPFIGDITPPPVATVPVVSAEPGTFVVSWDGLFVGGEEKPRDFEHVNVIGHKMNGAATVLSLTVGVIRLATESVFVATDVAAAGESWEFSLESEDFNGNKAVRGARSASKVMVDAISSVDVAWTDMKADVLSAKNASVSAQSAAADAQEIADSVAQNLSSTSAQVTAAQLKADQAFNTATSAATTAGEAQTAADGKGRLWYQDNAPTGTGHRVGDTWFDINDGNHIYVWDGSIWADARDTSIAAADSKAASALTAANGKNKIYYDTAMPTGGTYTKGDTWFDTDDGNKIYVHNGTTFVASALGNSAIADQAITNAKIVDATIQSAKIGSVDAGTITVGTLSATRIAAGSIGADKVVIGTGSNLAYNGSAEISTSTQGYTGFIRTTTDTPSGFKAAWQTPPTQSTINFLTDPAVAVKPQTRYRVNVWVKADKAGSVTFLEPMTGSVAGGNRTNPVYAFSGMAVPTVWTLWTSEFVTGLSPANTLYFRWFVNHSSGTVFDSVLSFTGFTLTEMNAGELIVDGAIKTNHMTSGTIDAGVLTAGSITAPKIAAKSITTDKLVISSSDNLILEADFGNGGSSWQMGANRSINATAGRGAMPAMRITGTVSPVTFLNVGNRIPVGADNRFRGSMFVKSSAAAVSGRFKIVARAYTTLTAFADVTIANSPALIAGAWTNVEGISPTLPANTISVEFYISAQNAATGTTADIDFVSVTRAFDGKLIVDGAIDGKTITGALFQTDNTPATGASARGIKLDTLGFRAYDPTGKPTFSVDALTGIVSSSGTYNTTAAEASLSGGGTMTIGATFGNLTYDSHTDFTGAPGIKFTRTHSSEGVKSPATILYDGSRISISTYDVDESFVPNSTGARLNVGEGIVEISATRSASSYDPKIPQPRFELDAGTPTNPGYEMLNMYMGYNPTGTRYSRTGLDIGKDYFNKSVIIRPTGGFTTSISTWSTQDPNIPSGGSQMEVGENGAWAIIGRRNSDNLLTTKIHSDWNGTGVSDNLGIDSINSVIIYGRGTTGSPVDIRSAGDIRLAPSGIVNVESNLTSTGIVQGATIKATGAVQGATAAITGAMTSASLTSTGTVQGASVKATTSYFMGNEEFKAGRYAEFSNSNWFQEGNQTLWDVGNLTFNAARSLNNDFVNAGPTAGKFTITKSGYYSMSVIQVPNGSMGNGWIRFYNTTTSKTLMQMSNAGWQWEQFCVIPAVYVVAGDVIHIQTYVTTARTTSCTVAIQKLF